MKGSGPPSFVPDHDHYNWHKIQIHETICNNLVGNKPITIPELHSLGSQAIETEGFAAL